MKWLRLALVVGCFARLACVSAAEVGVSESSITIGMSSPFSGQNGAYGSAMKEVIEAYFQQVNASGGVHGRKLVLVALDDGYETERTVANAKKLIDEHRAFALLAFYGSSPTTAAMNEIFGPAKVPLIGTISGADSLRTPVNRYMFNVRASYANETEAIVNQLVNIGVKSIAVFHQNDGFGRSGLDGVTAALKKHGLVPVAAGTVERNSTDVAPAVQAIAKANPQAVVMVTLYKPTAEFVRQMRKVGQNIQFMTLSPVGADMLVKELGDDARGIGISQVAPYPWNDTTPVVRDYRKLLTQHLKHERYSYYGVESYLMARVLIDALKRAGRDISREKLVATLESMQSHDLGGYQISYSPTNHNGSRFVDLTVIGSGGQILR